MPIRRPKKKNDDFMSEEMDERLQELEASISIVYTQANAEAEAKLERYLAQFREDDEIMQARLVEGEITQEEYGRWRDQHIIRRQEYARTINSLTDILTNADVAAMSIISNDLPYVIAQSYNFGQFVGQQIAEHEDIPNVSFQIYNAQSVQALIRDNPDILPTVDLPLDQQWNRTHINREITASIIGGDSIPRIAERLARGTNMDRNSAIRNARTSMTAAENLGRNESHRFITSQGINMVKRWSATYDSRTRATHRLLDDTTANAQGLFGEGILDQLGEPLMEYPADPKGAAAEVYNCRCRLNIVPPNYSRDVNAREYEKWMQENYPNDYLALQEDKYFDKLHKTDEWELQGRREYERRVISNARHKVADFELNNGYYIIKTFDDMPSTEQSIWARVINATNYEVSNRNATPDGNHYNPVNDTIYINQNVRTSTFFHETAHAMDNRAVHIQYIQNGEVSRTINGSASAAASLIYSQNSGSMERDNMALMSWLGINSLDREAQNIIRRRIDQFSERYSVTAGNILSDLIDAQTYGRLELPYGHGADYWLEDTHSRFREAWAGFCELRAYNQEEAIEEMRTIMPEMINSIDTAYNIVFAGEEYSGAHYINKNKRRVLEEIIIRNSWR